MFPNCYKLVEVDLMLVYCNYSTLLFQGPTRSSWTSSRSGIVDPSFDAAGGARDVSLPKDQSLQTTTARERQKESHRKRTTAT